MDFRVIFAPTSIRDLADSVSYIARFDPEAAARIGDGLIDRAEAFLSKHPLAGPQCREYDDDTIRYWLFRDYRIVYRVNDQQRQVTVLRFWHCSRGDWPIDVNSEHLLSPERQETKSPE